MAQQKTAVIIGAGPAGLTAALELLRQTDIHPIVLEESRSIGGIAQTMNHKGNRMDIGGHRFFSKDDRVMRWWLDVLPVQGSPSRDDLALGRVPTLSPGGPNPEREDRVMLVRERVSRILYLRKFFDYPISMKPETFLNMGFARTMKAGFGYVGSRLHRRPERTLEDFMINRFGRPLYGMFFEKYTGKVWGRHPRDISAAWGAQRIKGLSLTKAVLSALKKPFQRKADIAQKEQETSLISRFLYPKHGPGQLWETVAEEIAALGGEVRRGCRVAELNADGGAIRSVVYEQGGQRHEISCDFVFSTMPVKDLVAGLRGEDVPADVAGIAASLPYRDFVTVGLLVKRLKLRNTTGIKTLNGIVPDTWVYIQEDDVKIGRLQIFNNWSPYMVADPDTVWLGLEYFCNEGDELWAMDDAAFVQMAAQELVRTGVIEEDSVLDGVRFRVKKAYPAYFGVYAQFDRVKDYLLGFENLHCIGRNGQHRYNNMDHSMLTAMAAVDAVQGKGDRKAVWDINTEEDYHETKNQAAS